MDNVGSHGGKRGDCPDDPRADASLHRRGGDGVGEVVGTVTAVNRDVLLPLDTSRRDRAAFSCGEKSLDTWLQTFAGQAAGHDITRTYVAVDPGRRVLGYYSVRASA